MPKSKLRKSRKKRNMLSKQTMKRCAFWKEVAQLTKRIDEVENFSNFDIESPVVGESYIGKDGLCFPVIHYSERDVSTGDFLVYCVSQHSEYVLTAKQWEAAKRISIDSMGSYHHAMGAQRAPGQSASLF